MKINPLSDNVLVTPIEGEEKTKAGILLPDTVEKEKPEQGKVVAVGPGKYLSSGKIKPLDVKVGDIILFTKYGPTEIKVENKQYLIVKEDEILAIVK